LFVFYSCLFSISFYIDHEYMRCIQELTKTQTDYTKDVLVLLQNPAEHVLQIVEQ